MTKAHLLSPNTLQQKCLNPDINRHYLICLQTLPLDIKNPC